MLAYRGTSLQRCLPRITTCTMLGVAVALFEHHFGVGALDVTPIPFSFMGVAIGIFLGFRGKTAYDRYWEGRSLWGGLVNHTRNLARQILTLNQAPAEEQEALQEWRRQTIYLLVAFVHALRHLLRGSSPHDDLKDLVEPSVLSRLDGQRNPPVILLLQVGEQLRFAFQKKWIPEMHLPALDRSVCELTSLQGGCEKIRNTPVPYAYGVMSHRVVSIFCFGLPFGIVDDVKAYTPFVTLLVSYAFFGLDDLGTEIEEPFGTDPHDLPLSAICRTIEINLRQMLGEEQVPAPLVPVNHILE